MIGVNESEFNNSVEIIISKIVKQNALNVKDTNFEQNKSYKPKI